MAKAKKNTKLPAKAPKPASKERKSSKRTDIIPQRESDIKSKPKPANAKGSIEHEFPSKTKRGHELRSPFAGGGMVTFHFSKKSYFANEKDALRVLLFYKKHIRTWQVAKAWYAKGIKNTLSNGGVYKNRKQTQGWAGRNKVVGYSTGKGPGFISAKGINFLLRETQASVKAAITGRKGDYGQNLAIIFKPAPFKSTGSKMSFAINIFLDAKGLKFYKDQQRLL